MSDDLSILKHSEIVNISVACVVQKDGEYLLVQEKDGWNFPSGKVNLKENPIDAAIRETIEETGVEPKISGVVSVYYYRTKKNSYDRKKDRITVRINFKGKYAIEHDVVRKESNMQPAWLSKDAIRELVDFHKFRNWTGELLAKEVLENKEYPLDLLLIK